MTYAMHPWLAHVKEISTMSAPTPHKHSKAVLDSTSHKMDQPVSCMNQMGLVELELIYCNIYIYLSSLGLRSLEEAGREIDR